MFSRVHKDVGLTCEDESLTEQHHKRRCDINSMVNRLMGGDITVLNSKPPVYADVSEIPDNIQAVLNGQIDARRAFEGLPDDVRRRYPTAEEFFHAVNDEGSRETFAKLGLLRQEQANEPVKVEVINPAAPAIEQQSVSA